MLGFRHLDLRAYFSRPDLQIDDGRLVLGAFPGQGYASLVYLCQTVAAVGILGRQVKGMSLGVSHLLGQSRPPLLVCIQLRLGLADQGFLIVQLLLCIRQLPFGGRDSFLCGLSLDIQFGQLGLDFVAPAGQQAPPLAPHSQVALHLLHLAVQFAAFPVPARQVFAQLRLPDPQGCHLLVLIHQGLAATVHPGFAPAQGIPAPEQVPLLLPPAIAVPRPQHPLQLLVEQRVATGPLRVPLQAAQSRGNLVDNVIHPQQVRASFLQAREGVGPLGLVQRNARRLLKQRPPGVRAQTQDRIHQPLADDRVGAPRQPRLGQQLPDVPQAHPAAVQQVFVLPRAVGAPGNRHLGKVDGQPAVGVIQGQGRRSHAQPCPLRATGKDHVLRALSPQRAIALFPQHPANGIGDVALTAAVRPDDGRDAATVENKLGAQRKRLVSL